MVNLTQPLIDAMDHKIFNNNPIPINVLLGSLGFVFGTSLVVYVWVQGRRMTKENAAQMSVRERWERYGVIPEEDENSNLSI